MFRFCRAAATAVVLFLCACEGQVPSPDESDPFAPVAEASETLTLACDGLAQCPQSGSVYTSLYRAGLSPTSRGDLVQTFTSASTGTVTGVSLVAAPLRPVSAGNTLTLQVSIVDLTGSSAENAANANVVGAGSVVLSDAVARVHDVPVTANLVQGTSYALVVDATLANPSETTLLGVGAWTGTGDPAGGAYRGTARRLSGTSFGVTRYRPAGDADVAFGLHVVCGGTGQVCCSGPTPTWYQDADADGYGNPSAPQISCAQPGGYVADATDCNDGAASAHPGAPETCWNAIDENCDGHVCGVGDPCPIPHSTYLNLRSRVSGLCLDGYGGNAANGADVVQAVCNAGQKWDFEPAAGGAFNVYTSLGNNQCLDRLGGNTSNGGEVVHAFCNSGQTWIPTVSETAGYCYIRSAQSGLCLDVLNGSTANGANVVQAFCNAGQVWTWF